MSTLIKNALIVGGGFSGMSAAIQLRKRGIDVDLVEIDAGWRSYGAGISIGGATLRAFRTLGILSRFLDEGFAGDGTDLHTRDGHLLAQLPTPRIAGDDVPGNGAVMRPVLAKILADKTLAVGTKVRLGCTITTLEQDAEGVDVAFSDGTRGRYDLVIAADGLYSKMRERLLPDAPKPRYSGQGVWRAVLPRLPDVNRTLLWVSDTVKVGLNPVSRDEMYLFVNEIRPTNEHVPPTEFLPRLRALLDPFAAPLVQQARALLNEDSLIIFRPLEGLLVPQPWYHGRVVLIGDTVHATTPHLASGACIGIEDAIVLAEELGYADSLAVALERFQSRRWARCRMVVENSARLGDIEIRGGDKDEHARIMRQSFLALAEPI
ncbi:FAD-dependent oxidoreductase [Thauera sp.]|jgi:2-polyprenyl-6-methoxyphenol hydroxylase-like FAD-dependent oxidoreductase|uniref:FAD-dependent oxidoreductase n=1 Tax=Thauera sp. TaxID=1905334 RepID=UPI002CD1E808|nr:FAD-dependent oxidoreductase [Thauera sp.]HRO36792.1 FAD-dependent oxidoreductase [Thauera sp.]